jgi:hypothetical protein
MSATQMRSPAPRANAENRAEVIGKRQIQIWHQQGIFAPVLYFGKSPRVRRVDLAAWIAAGDTKSHAKPARSRKRRA